jgi:diguanylate cyclase (GGDEF)-like protein
VTHWYRIAFFIPIVPIVIALLLMLNINRQWETTYTTYFPLTQHLTQLRNNLNEGHLWLEEAIAGDTSIDLDTQVFEHFEHPRFEKLIYQDFGLYSEVEDGVATALKEIDDGADQLLILVHERLENTVKHAVGSTKDEEFDKSFLVLVHQIDQTHNMIQSIIDYRVAQQKSLFLYTTILFTLVSLYIFYRFYRMSLKLHSQKQKFEHDAHHDKLTGVANRHRLNQEMEHIDQLDEKSDCAFILMDIDHFKVINDTYGHVRGDEVLKEISSIMAQSIRGSDLLGRWGGEEFLLICKGISIEHAIELSERIRLKIERHDFGLERGVSGSFGVASLESGQSSSDAIHHADMALYEAKANGRNQVVRFSTDN